MSVLSFNSSSELLDRLREADEQTSRDLITQLYDLAISSRSQTANYESELKLSSNNLLEVNAINSRLKEEVSCLQSSLSSLQQSSAIAMYKLTEAESALETSRQHHADTSGLNRQSDKSIRSEIFRIDEKFTGMDKSLYPSFQNLIRVALAQNADRYITLQSKITLIYQNLGLGPKSFLDRYLLDDGNFNFDSLEEVWSVLDVSYRNPNEEEDARAALHRLQQGNLPFGMYLAEFQRLHNLSRISDHKTLISNMRSGVSSELRTCISQHQDIHKSYTFDEFVSLCKDCAIRIDLDKSPNFKTPTHYPKYNYQTPSRASMTSSNVASGANGVPLGGDPMVLDKADMSHIGSDGHITPEERQRRFRYKLCMRCGKPGHRANDCNPKIREKIISELTLDEKKSDLVLEDLKE